jgi:hypothetical protein
MSASDLDRLKSDIDEIFPDLVATRKSLWRLGLKPLMPPLISWKARNGRGCGRGLWSCIPFLPSIKRKQLVRSP